MLFFLRLNNPVAKRDHDGLRAIERTDHPTPIRIQSDQRSLLRRTFRCLVLSASSVAPVLFL
jgi:hypothetical protein